MVFVLSSNICHSSETWIFLKFWFNTFLKIASSKIASAIIVYFVNILHMRVERDRGALHMLSLSSARYICINWLPKKEEYRQCCSNIWGRCDYFSYNWCSRKVYVIGVTQLAAPLAFIVFAAATKHTRLPLSQELQSGSTSVSGLHSCRLKRLPLQWLSWRQNDRNVWTIFW